MINTTSGLFGSFFSNAFSSPADQSVSDAMKFACENLEFDQISSLLSQGENPYYRFEVDLDCYYVLTRTENPLLTKDYSEESLELSGHIVSKFSKAMGRFESFELPVALAAIIAGRIEFLDQLMDQDICLAHLLDRAKSTLTESEYTSMVNEYLLQQLKLLALKSDDSEFEKLLTFAFEGLVATKQLDQSFFQSLAGMGVDEQRVYQLLQLIFKYEPLVVDSDTGRKLSIADLQASLFESPSRSGEFNFNKTLLLHLFKRTEDVQSYRLWEEAVNLITENASAFISAIEATVDNMEIFVKEHCETLLELACESSSMELVELVQKHGVQITKERFDEGALFDILLSDRPSLELLLFCVSLGFDPRSVDEDGDSLLDILLTSSEYSKYPNPELLGYLLKLESPEKLATLNVAGCDLLPDQYDVVYLPPTLEDVKNAKETIEVLKEAGVNLTYHDNTTSSLLMEAIAKHYPVSFIQYLLNEGFDPNEVVDGLPLIYRVTQLPHYFNEILSVLKEAGLDLKSNVKAGLDRWIEICENQGVKNPQTQQILKNVQYDLRMIDQYTESELEKLLNTLVEELGFSSLDEAIQYEALNQKAIQHVMDNFTPGETTVEEVQDMFRNFIQGSRV